MARTTQRDAASVSQKSVGTESTDEVVDPVSMPTTPKKEALDHALARIESDDTPAGSNWRLKFAPVKWIQRGAASTGAGGKHYGGHHKRHKSADAVMASTLVSWTSVATEDGLVSLVGGENLDERISATAVPATPCTRSSTFVVSPKATQQASELLRRAASCDQNEEGETMQQFPDDHALDRVTIDFRELSKADKEILLPTLWQQGSGANSTLERASNKHPKTREASSSTRVGKNPSDPAAAEHTAAPETLLERFGRIADTTCGGAACNCMEDPETEKGVEMIHVNDSLLDEEVSDQDTDTDGEQSCWTEVEVSIAPRQSRTNMWTKIARHNQSTSATSANQRVSSFSTNVHAARGERAIAEMESATKEAKKQDAVASKKEPTWSLRPIRSHRSTPSKKKSDQRRQKQQHLDDEHGLEVLTSRFTTPPRSPPAIKHFKDSKIVADLDLPIASPHPEDEGMGLEVMADLSTPPRRVPRSLSTDIPSVGAETTVVNNLSTRRRSKLDPRFFIDTSYGHAHPNPVSQSVAVKDGGNYINDQLQTPSDNRVAQQNPAHPERLARRTPSLDRLEARCDSKVVLTTSPFRQQSTLDLWNAAADKPKLTTSDEDPRKTKVQQNVTRMRQIVALASSDEIKVEDVSVNATSKATADHDDDTAEPDLLTPRRSIIDSEEKERVLRNISRIRTVAGLPDTPSLNVKQCSSTVDRSNEKSRSEILLPAPCRSTTNSPDRLRRSSSADRALAAQPMKLQEYIRGRYSKHAVGYTSIGKFDFYDDACDELAIEQVYQEPEVVEPEVCEERDAAPDFDLLKLKQRFSEDEVSFLTQDKSPMNLHAFVKGRGKNTFQVGLLNKYGWSGKKKPSEISVPVQSISLCRSKSASSLYDLRQVPVTEDSLVTKEIRNETDKLEITMTMEEDTFRLEDETVGIETFASNRHLLAIVPVGAQNNAMNSNSRRPWQRLRSIGGRVKL